MADEPFSHIDHLLKHNFDWATEQCGGCLGSMSLSQTPTVLWIGCSDSRVPETTLTGQCRNHLFVTRNIANQFQENEPNVLAVLHHAINGLNIREVMVVGHTNCGGVNAALQMAQPVEPESTPKSNPVHKWMEPLAQLARQEGLQVNVEHTRKLHNINILTQMNNIRKSSVIQVFKEEHPNADVHVRGFVFNMRSGLLEEVNEPKPEPVENV